VSSLLPSHPNTVAVTTGPSDHFGSLYTRNEDPPKSKQSSVAMVTRHDVYVCQE